MGKNSRKNHDIYSIYRKKFQKNSRNILNKTEKNSRKREGGR